MPTLTIKNLPETLHARLKLQAQSHRRSLNQEAIHCLEEMLRTRDAPAAPGPDHERAAWLAHSQRTLMQAWDHPDDDVFNALLTK